MCLSIKKKIQKLLKDELQKLAMERLKKGGYEEN